MVLMDDHLSHAAYVWMVEQLRDSADLL
jgi:hypothetical protein